MLRNAGSYYVIGYGENINVPTIDIISREINFIGNLVGSYNDLAELMTLDRAGQGHAAHERLSAGRRQRRDGRPRRRAACRAAASSSPTPPEREDHSHGQDHPLQRRRAPAPAAGRRHPRRHGQGDARAEGPQRRPRAPHRRADDHERRRHDRARDRALRPVPEHGRAARARGRRQDLRADRRRHDDGDAARAVADPRGHARARRRRQPDAAAPRHRGRGRARRRRARSAARARSTDVDHLRQVATIAAKEDERIGGAVAEALDRVGEDGVVIDRGERAARRSPSTSSRACTSRTATCRRTSSATGCGWRRCSRTRTS